MSEKMYRFYSYLGKNPAGVEIIDQPGMLEPSREDLFFGHWGEHGFKPYDLPEKIQFLHRKRWGRKPLDFENFNQFWMMSESCKDFFEEFCPSSMDFAPGILAFEDGTADRKVWLADVTRVLDALDETSSDVTIGGYYRTYIMGKSNKLFFLREAVRGEHLFRMKYAEGQIICDASFRAEFKRRKLKEATFIELGGTVP